MTKHHLICLIVFAREKSGQTFKNAWASTGGYNRKSVAALKVILKKVKS
jgi:hypothetical protein